MLKTYKQILVEQETISSSLDKKAILEKLKNLDSSEKFSYYLLIQGANKENNYVSKFIVVEPTNQGEILMEMVYLIPTEETNMFYFTGEAQIFCTESIDLKNVIEVFDKEDFNYKISDDYVTDVFPHLDDY